MPISPQETSYQDRLVALKLLRENMFYNNPSTYAFTDIAEDLPGNARAIAPLFKNVLPSAAIISEDPEERSQQIDAAIARIKATKKSKQNLLSEMWHNVKHLTPEAVKAGLIFSAIPSVLGFRKPWKRNAAGSLRPQMPVAPIDAIKKLFSPSANRIVHTGNAPYRDLSRGRHAKRIKDILSGGLYGGAYTAGAGVAVPLLAGNYELSDKALEEAKAIMQQNPYLTSLPASEMLSAIRAHKNNTTPDSAQRVKNTLLGAGLGAITALPTAVLPAFMSGAGRFAGNALGRLAGKLPNFGVDKIKSLLQQHTRNTSLSDGVRRTVMNKFKKDIPSAMRWGVGLGGLSGVLSSNNPIIDEYENYRPDQT